MDVSYIKNLIRPSYYKLKDFGSNVLMQATYKIHCFHRGYIGIWDKGLAFLMKLNTYKIQSVKEFSHEQNLSSSMIRDKRKGESFSLVYSIEDSPKSYSSNLPDLLLTLFSNVLVIGGCDGLVDYKKKILISDVSASIDTEIYENAKGFIESQHKRYAIGEKINNYSEIATGISLCTCFSNNYYHSLYDCFLKLLIVDSLDIKQDIPLIVDSDIKAIPQLYEIFLLLNKKNREVIWVDKGMKLLVNKLYYLNSVHIQPHQIKNVTKINYADFRYDISALRMLRETCLKIKEQKKYPKKIFLSRKGHVRRKYNEDELFEVIRKHGFEIVHPETYSFKQQVSIFNQADVIVGPTGAAFTNILFCHPGAIGICLMGKEMNIPIFTAGSYVANARLLYFIGNNTSLTTSSHEIQSDFIIDASKFDEFLNDVEKCVESNNSN